MKKLRSRKLRFYDVVEVLASKKKGEVRSWEKQRAKEPVDYNTDYHAP